MSGVKNFFHDVINEEKEEERVFRCFFCEELFTEDELEEYEGTLYCNSCKEEQEREEALYTMDLAEQDLLFRLRNAPRI